MFKATCTWDNTTASSNEIQGIIMAGWGAYAKHRDLVKSNLAIEETRIQLLCAASCDIWCRDMDTDKTSTKQTSGRTDQYGKKCAQHHIQG